MASQRRPRPVPIIHAALGLLVDAPDWLRARLAEAGRMLARGQLMELLHARDLSLSPAMRLQIITLKTASVFGLACEVGSRLAGAARAVVVAQRRFGEAYGRLFQIADDVDDLFAGEDEQGRRPATDLRGAVMSLPFVYGLRTPARARLAETLDPSASDHVARLETCRTLLRASGALSQTLQVARRQADDAREAIATLPASWSSAFEDELVDATLARIVRFAEHAPA